MSDEPLTPGERADVRRQLDELLWYHTIDVAPGVSTLGGYDIRHALPLMPFPDVEGKRCLDIGTWDGFYAFEMERRGAEEVVALDVPDMSEVDYPPDARASDVDLSLPGVQSRPAGFQLLHRLLESKVKWHPGNVYDVDRGDLGTFDLVVIGSLLVHLRDPVRALDAVRRVVRGQLLVADYVHTPLALWPSRRPLFELRGQGTDFQWWLASDQGLRHLLHVGGFQIEAESPYYLLRYGRAHAPAVTRPKTRSELAKYLVNYAMTRDRVGGHLHRAYRCHPRF